MTPEETDQQAFDEQVNRKGKLFLQVAAGVGVFAAVIMSLIALVVSTGPTTTTVIQAARQPVAATVPAAPMSARVMIDHVTKGCHTFAINGGAPGKPTATIHLANGGTLHLQNNDVMPHHLVLKSGTGAQIVSGMMSHMGAQSTVTFTAPGRYVFVTKPGEDYTKGIVTTGADNKLRLNVIVGSTAS